MLTMIVVLETVETICHDRQELTENTPFKAFLAYSFVPDFVNHIHIHHLNNLIFVYSQYLLLRESSITTFEQGSFRYLLSAFFLLYTKVRKTYIHISKRASSYETDVHGEEGIGVTFTFEF